MPTKKLLEAVCVEGAGAVCLTADRGVRGWQSENSHSGGLVILGVCADMATLKLGTIGIVHFHGIFGGRVGHLHVRVKL